MKLNKSPLGDYNRQNRSNSCPNPPPRESPKPNDCSKNSARCNPTPSTIAIQPKIIHSPTHRPNAIRPNIIPQATVRPKNIPRNPIRPKMISAIDDQISTEEDWKIFQHNFDRIHSGFFHILKERYPELTTTDLRFCSLLCQNMSSKEIATMMNISLKGVEAARYRIRKKMNLDSGVSLTEFLINLE